MNLSNESLIASFLHRPVSPQEALSQETSEKFKSEKHEIIDFHIEITNIFTFLMKF